VVIVFLLKGYSVDCPFRQFAVMASKTVLVPVAHGTEEMEAGESISCVSFLITLLCCVWFLSRLLFVAVIIIDVLRRAGATVTVASVEDSLQVRSVFDGLCLGSLPNGIRKQARGRGR
jgi:hypothetical protein